MSNDENESATRARNRTVMLTPDITGQVRARLAQETSSHSNEESHDDPDHAQDNYHNEALEGARGATGGFNLSSQAQSGFTQPQANSSYVPAKDMASSSSQSGFIASNVNQTMPGVNVKNGMVAARPQSQTTAPAASFHAPTNSNANSNVVWNKITPLVGFLVSFDNNENGDVYDLRTGRLIISSEPAAGWSYILINDESVSPMHAILRIDETGAVQVLDQLSEHGTRIKRFGSEEEEQISGEKSTIEHGDLIKFGDRTFHVCILALSR